MQRHNQSAPTNEYPAKFLERIHSDATCQWCKHPEKPLHRAGLCRHCWKISREVSKLESRVQECKERKQSISFDLDFHLKSAKKMIHLAKMEGSAYGDIHRKDVTGLDLEHQFSLLSKALIRKDLFYGEANLFDWCFSLDQKRLIYYLISKLKRERLRRARRGRAKGLVAGGDSAT